MNQDERIEQFRKMAQANPDDDLAHFALGQALVDAGRNAEAVNVLRHVLKINQGYSRAYVLLGDAQLATEDEMSAIETYQNGYAAAMSRGDLMPGMEMKSKLEALGETVSADAILAAAAPDGVEKLITTVSSTYCASSTLPNSPHSTPTSRANSEASFGFGKSRNVTSDGGSMFS